MRVAFVHDWLVTHRGGERVLEALLTLYPEAPIYTLFFDPTELPESITSRKVYYPKWLNKAKFMRKVLLPIFPAIVESFDLFSYDLVISTSSCVAKGAICGPDAKHVSYIHSPMRYIWDQKGLYLDKFNRVPLLRTFAELTATRLRIWDQVSSQRVDRFIANSNFVKNRISKYYRRESKVIHPPIDWEAFAKANPYVHKDRYVLCAGALVGYKRFDLAIEAARRANIHLIVAGGGPQREMVEAASGNQLTFINNPPFEKFSRLLAGAEALLMPGVEDFGMIAIEAMAAGTPVISVPSGGAKDFIVPQETGTFTRDHSLESMIECLKEHKKEDFSRQKLVDFASKFSKDIFLSQVREQIGEILG